MMRYYEVYRPSQREPFITSNVRRLRDLPDGTKVFRTITDRNGSLIEQEEISVENGRVRINGLGKQRPKIWYG